MDRLIRQILIVLVALWLLPCGTVQAKIEAPDHVYYGTATLYGAPVANGTVLEARSKADGTVLRRFVMGNNSHLGAYYKLAIPLDTVDPRTEGRARVGDPIQIYLNGLLAAEVSVGIDPVQGVKGVGSTTRLDLDPQNMGTGPAISIEDQSVVEGHAGITPVDVVVTLGSTVTQAVSVSWETRDGTAQGGTACGAGVDFIARSNQTLTIPAGQSQGVITVDVCGDTEVEPNETFSVVLLGTVGGYGVLTTSSTATVTILDDDDVPSLSIGAVRVAEPVSGTATANFVATLSRRHSNPVSFTWTTQDGTARAGEDYQSAGGTVTIPAGELAATMSVTVLADAVVEPDETFRIVLGHPVSVTLLQTQAWATIVDPRFDPVLQESSAITGVSVPDLSKPSAIALSPDGRFAYAVSRDKHAVLKFDRDSSTGALSLSNPVSYKSSDLPGAKLTAPQDLAISADGGYVYVAAMNDNAITVLARDTNDGSLSFMQSLVQGGSIADMKKPVRLALSPDGEQVYVLAQESNAVVTFNRSASGELSFARSITSATPGLARLLTPSGLVMSPDGAQVYVTTQMGNAVLVLDRTTNTASGDFGKLTVGQTIVNGQNGVTAHLNGAIGVAISPDGQQVYVLAQQDNALVTFDRATNGRLTFRKEIRHGEEGVFGLKTPQAIEMAPNGKEVFVTASPLDGNDSLSIFSRAASGQLNVRRALFKGDAGQERLSIPGEMAASGDDRFVYVAASGGDSAIVVYERLPDPELFKDGFEGSP